MHCVALHASVLDWTPFDATSSRRQCACGLCCRVCAWESNLARAPPCCAHLPISCCSYASQAAPASCKPLGCNLPGAALLLEATWDLGQPITTLASLLPDDMGNSGGGPAAALLIGTAGGVLRLISAQRLTDTDPAAAATIGDAFRNAWDLKVFSGAVSAAVLSEVRAAGMASGQPPSSLLLCRHACMIPTYTNGTTGHVPGWGMPRTVKQPSSAPRRPTAHPRPCAACERRTATLQLLAAPRTTWSRCSA